MTHWSIPAAVALAALAPASAAAAQGWPASRSVVSALGALAGAAAGWLLAAWAPWDVWGPGASLPRPVLTAAAAVAMGAAILVLDRLAHSQGARGGGVVGVALGMGAAAGCLLASGFPVQELWHGGVAPVFLTAGATAGLVLGASLGWLPFCAGPLPRWGLVLGSWLGAFSILESGILAADRGRHVGLPWIPWALAALLLIAAAVGAALIGRRGERLLRREIAAEVELGVLPPWLAGVALRVGSPAMVRCWPQRRERVVVVGMLRRLALLRLDLKRRGAADKSLHGIEVGRLRARLRSLVMPSSRGDVTEV